MLYGYRKRFYKFKFDPRQPKFDFNLLKSARKMPKLVFEFKKMFGQ